MSYGKKVTLSFVIPGIIGTAIGSMIANPLWSLFQQLILGVMFGTVIGLLGTVIYGFYDLVQSQKQDLPTK